MNSLDLWYSISSEIPYCAEETPNRLVFRPDCKVFDLKNSYANCVYRLELQGNLAIYVLWGFSGDREVGYLELLLNIFSFS